MNTGFFTTSEWPCSITENATEIASLQPNATKDVAFPASNWLGVPDLAPEMRRGVPLPVKAWGQTSRNKHHAGTWHFYTADYRFSALERKPESVINTRCAAACELNYSVFDDTPVAVALWTIYKKRYYARMWQECGIQVFIDCNMPERILDREESRYGIPASYSCFATRGYERRFESLAYEYQWATSFGCGVPAFLVVGGGRKVAEWCERTPGAIHAGYSGTKRVYSASLQGE